MSFLNKYSLKVLLISIMIVINIIGVIAVVVTVTSTYNELDESIKTGKVNTESSEKQEYNVDEANISEGADYDMGFKIDFVNILKVIMQNRNTRLLLALVICGLILLLDTILIFIKIKFVFSVKG